MFMMVSLAAADAHAFAGHRQQTKQFCFKHQPRNRLMFMMFALAAADAHASTRPRLPDFLIDRPHDSRFQIDSRFPDLHAPSFWRSFRSPDFQTDLHALSFQIPELRVLKQRSPGFQIHDFWKSGSCGKLSACKSGNLECLEIGPRKSEIWDLETYVLQKAGNPAIQIP